MCACCAPAQDNRFRSKASQLWPWGAFPEGSLESVEQRRYRLGVRTPDSQSGNPGSIPGTATTIPSATCPGIRNPLHAIREDPDWHVWVPFWVFVDFPTTSCRTRRMYLSRNQVDTVFPLAEE